MNIYYDCNEFQFFLPQTDLNPDDLIGNNRLVELEPTVMIRPIPAGIYRALAHIDAGKSLNNGN